MPNVGPLEFVVILVILAIFVVPIVALVLYLSRVRPAAPAAPGAQAVPVATAAERDPAVELLRRRLAIGEIDEVEYRRLRAALQGH